jgi:hypothetical protein
LPVAWPRGAAGLRPPCSRQRLRPRMAGRWHGVPPRVLAPHRGACLTAACSCTAPGGLPQASKSGVEPMVHRVDLKNFGRPLPSFPYRNFPRRPGNRPGVRPFIARCLATGRPWAYRIRMAIGETMNCSANPALCAPSVVGVNRDRHPKRGSVKRFGQPF